MSVRDYVFTAWEPVAYEPHINNIKYICWGEEKCPTSNKLHYQGFVIFNRTCRIPMAKKWLGSNTIHLEKRRGTRDEARNYALKENNNIFEYGQYDNLTKEQLFKKSKKFLLDNSYYEFYNRYKKVIDENQDKGERWRQINTTWLWGTPGCGKTRQVMEMEDVYKIDFPYQWWDGYNEEDILLIDDWQDNAIPRGTMLNLLDGYRLRLPTKGGHTYARWTKVFITSNKSPEEYCIYDSALARRVNVTVCG